MKIKDLRLALTANAKNDVRDYLNGVKITTNDLVASDGHRLVRVVFDNSIILPDGRLQLIIPYAAIKQFLGKLAKVPHHLPVEIKLGLYPEQYVLECGGVIEFFTPIDAKYPSFDKFFEIIAKDDGEGHSMLQFNWRYIYEAHEGLSKWADSVSASLHTTKEGQFGWFALDNVVYIIMSIKL